MYLNRDDLRSQIVLRLPQPTKGRYVAAARAKGQSLTAWCIHALNRAAHTEPKPPTPEKPCS